MSGHNFEGQTSLRSCFHRQWPDQTVFLLTPYIYQIKKIRQNTVQYVRRSKVPLSVHNWRKGISYELTKNLFLFMRSVMRKKGSDF